VSFKHLVSAAVLFGAVVAANSATAQSGDDLFAQNCAPCHQPAGEGVPGAFPALAGNTFVQGDPKDPAWVVTHGRGGMPNFAEDLSDAQIATILTFVRSSWGNKAGPVDEATVKGVRSQPAPPNNQGGLPFH
jgi:mono/diheme cytochrome c family protein